MGIRWIQEIPSIRDNIYELAEYEGTKRYWNLYERPWNHSRIRPDVIRASKIIRLLSENKNITYDFIWSPALFGEYERCFL